MRTFVLALVAATPLAIVVACVGSDPEPVAATGDAATAPTTTSSSSSSSGSSSSSSGSGGDSAPPPACTGISVTTLAGSGDPGFENGTGTAATFNGVDGITVDPTLGTLYVADHQNGAIRSVTPEGGVVKTYVSGTNVDNTKRLVFANGDLYVTNSDFLVRVTGTPPAAVSPVVYSGIIAIAVGPDGARYATGTTYCQVAVSPSGGTSFTTFSGKESSETCGLADGDKGTALYSHNLVDLVFDTTDATNWKLFVADAGNQRIRVLDKNGTVSPFANASFAKLGGLTFDAQNRLLYVTDGTKIRKVTAAGDVTTLVGSDDSGFKDGNGCDAKFGDLKGIVFDKGALFAVDTNRIRKIVLP